MDMIDAMKKSEAVEIGLRSGHIIYGKFRSLIDNYFAITNAEGESVFVPSDDNNIAYVKLISADLEISQTMDKLYEKQRLFIEEPIEEPIAKRIDEEPIILSAPPTSRQAAIEAIKEKHRHNTNFTANQTKPTFRPRIQIEEDE